MKFIAHRGESYDAPENTLPAFKLAWDNQADGIEGDFRLTADKQIVCIHDESAIRTSSRACIISETSLEDLFKLDFGSWKAPEWQGTIIPTLDEILSTAPNYGDIYLELKTGPEVLEPLAEVLAESKVNSNRIKIITFDEKTLAESRKNLKQIEAFLLKGISPELEANPLEEAKKLVKELKALDANGIDICNGDFITPEFVDIFHQAGLSFHVWTVDELERARFLQKCGIDSLTSNRACWLKDKI
jgi:glycerophosphoryl diester phosphodiesterase